MEAAAVAEHLSKTYRVGFWGRKVRAVVDLSLEVRQGEIFGLLGPNGAGKTTTIKLLLGFVRPTTGQARVAGHPAGSIAARRRVGYLPENPALYEYLNGIEYLRFAGKLAGLSAAEAARRADELLDKVGLTGRADRAPRRFSKGRVPRRGLARALIGDPELFSRDEPMSGLDPIGRKDVRDLIFSLRGEGRTVLFSTHILSDVEAICDRIGIIAQGRLTDCGTLSSLLKPGVRAVEVVAQNVPRDLVARLASDGAKVLERDDGTVLTFSSEESADLAVRELVAKGGRLVSLAPHRDTLEALFVQRARGSAQP